MIRYFKLISIIIKSSLRLKFKGILRGRYFAGVEFYNKKNIIVNENSWIEPGSRLLVTDPIKIEANIYVEEKCWIGRDVEIQTNYGSKITIKKNASIQDRCKILGSVYIGQDSLLAPDVFLSSGNHYYDYHPELLIKQQDKLLVGFKEGFMSKNSPIVIEEDCWIGKNSLVTKGVNIGRGAIIGANSFVNKNVPPYEIWAGTPAKFVKKRLDFEPPLEIQSGKVENKPYFYRGFDHSGNGENGFLSEDSSLCLLAPSNSNSLFLRGEIYVEGELRIWANEKLIYNDTVIPGKFSELMVLRRTLNHHISSGLYQESPDNIRQFLCIVFEFKHGQPKKLKGFSINRIEQNDQSN